ncbi:MAG: N-acetylmuramoyl-L-alanine amidase [Actinobacteria bacterium]|nr:N-acetylmuramoyl-L-alanine amidase [Actinomycetota bacterium]MBW3650017.1 N-acetylmuramoyl-L-alanine amidase [Actinomycetota bacterium]
MVALAVMVAGVVVPVRTAWSAPQVRLEELAADPGSTVELPHPSSHLGVRWRGDDADAVELRWRGALAAQWSQWQPVTISHDLGDEERGVILSGLVIAEDATAAQVRVVAGNPRAVEVVAIDTRHGPRRLVVRRPPPATPAGADQRVPQPSVVTRAQWGADESMRGHEPPEYAPLVRMAVHHTATPEGPDPAATVRAIYAYHTKSNGWNDIGYNFLVDSFGRIYEGRWARNYAPGEIPTGENTNADGVTGAHVSGNNPGTVGIALLGDFTGLPPSRAAVDGLQRMLAWKADRHFIDPTGTTNWSNGQRPTIVGHRDVGATACPGDFLYEQLPTIRQNVANMVGPGRFRGTTTGYWVLARNSSLYTFGDAPFLGGPGISPAPTNSIAPTRTGLGYWILSANGRVTPYGDAGFYGSTESMRLNAPAVRLEPTSSGRGYWIQAADGGIFAFGDAGFYGSTGAMKLNSPVISMAATPSGRGYWLLAGDGGVFTFGDGGFYGSTGAMKLNAPVASMAPHPSGRGYWLQATDGGIFSFGAVGFHGSVPGLGLANTAKTVQIRATPTGRGYYVLGADGGIFTFGDSRYHGSLPALAGDGAAVDLALKNTVG